MTDKQIQKSAYKKIIKTLDLLKIYYIEHSAQTGTIYLTVDNIGKIRIADHCDAHETAKYDVSPSGYTAKSMIETIEEITGKTIKQANKKEKRIQQLKDFADGKWMISDLIKHNNTIDIIEWVWGMKYESKKSKSFINGIDFIFGNMIKEATI